MGKQTGISWTDHTFNPWRGCTKVSAGCANCYAETMSKRSHAIFGVWGDAGKRVVAAESYWRQPLAWDREAKAAAVRRRVFCASIADVFEDWRGPMVDAQGRTLGTTDGDLPWTGGPGDPSWYPATRLLTMADVRARLFDVINATPNLDWLLLTKRPENMEAMLPWTSDHAGEYRERYWLNVWLGATVENQAAADARIPHLLKIPAAVRFLSVEPMLGPVDFDAFQRGICVACAGGGETYGHYWSDNGMGRCVDCGGTGVDSDNSGVHWVIFGGESGSGARWCDIAWIRDVVRQCEAAGVACFVKQLGANALDTTPPAAGWSSTCDFDRCVHLRHPAGADPAEWPADLRVQEFPVIKGE